MEVSVHLSIIIPAYNEERYLEATLSTIRKAEQHLQEIRPADTIEIIVVDNDSADRTSEIAAYHGCRVVREEVRNISRVRNVGARQANGDVLVFIDADTLVPPTLFELILQRMDDPKCLGGAVDVLHKPAKRLIRCYLLVWRVVGKLTGMAQGAAQFWRSSRFTEEGGYDESLFMGEDVEFYWKMKRYSSKLSGYVAFIDEVKVVPSPRRFDQWSIWKTLVKTNPVYILFYRKTKRAWSGWYEDRPE